MTTALNVYENTMALTLAILSERLGHYIEGLEIDIERLDEKDKNKDKNIVENLIDISDVILLKKIVDDLEKILEG